MLGKQIHRAVKAVAKIATASPDCGSKTWSISGGRNVCSQSDEQTSSRVQVRQVLTQFYSCGVCYQLASPWRGLVPRTNLRVPPFGWNPGHHRGHLQALLLRGPVLSKETTRTKYQTNLQCKLWTYLRCMFLSKQALEPICEPWSQWVKCLKRWIYLVPFLPRWYHSPKS